MWDSLRHFHKVILLLASPLAAQVPGIEHFEKKIRPVLAEKCYSCHSSKLKAPMGGLVLDSKAGVLKGGATGAVIIRGKPNESRLLKAMRFVDPHLQMPPGGKLPDTVIADFERWIAEGAPDPRSDEPAAPSASVNGMSMEAGRKWWAFQPVTETAPPPVQRKEWPRTKSDRFLLAQLEKAGLDPSPPADPRALIRRLYINLTGIPSSYEEVEAFAADPSDAAYKQLVERLLDSPRYGERWGRYWLDVARFGEDNPTSEATNPPYPYAWRYRDWVIEAFNQDLPYNRFVQLQLAADLIPDASRDDYRALGYLGAAPIYHKDARLSRDVIETLASDDWDERVDAVSRGLLGLTVACARCHDHKFDPITEKDYYGLASVFASTSAVERPIAVVDADLEREFLHAQQRLIHLDYLAKLLTGEPGTKPEEAAAKVKLFRAEIAAIQKRFATLGTADELASYIARFGREERRRRDAGGPDPSGPFVNAVYDAALWVDGADPDLTRMEYRPAAPRDLPVFLRGNVASHGEIAPRRFPEVLTKADGKLTHGSGRRELAEKIFTDAAPLAARVIVNRVWGWHFGNPLVATASDFGTQGEKPTHPQLLDDLAARFIANGWSLKWLHREILLSAAYRQSSHPVSSGEQKDPANRLLWRMNPRRMDFESFRDAILTASGKLDSSMYGPSSDLDQPKNTRRTVYAKISRSRLNTLFRLYDFSDPSQHSPGRDQTTTPLQQLFVMNSEFMEKQAVALANRVEDSHDRIGDMYRLAFSRTPTAVERDLAASYLASASLERFAQALLAANEFIFWP